MQLAAVPQGLLQVVLQVDLPQRREHLAEAVLQPQHPCLRTAAS
jgi:hypothetical protein